MRIRTASEKKRIIRRIRSEIADRNLTVEKACFNNGVHYSTYYAWVKQLGMRHVSPNKIRNNGGRVVRKYSSDEKSRALSTLVVFKGDIAATSNKMGIPESTIRTWANNEHILIKGRVRNNREHLSEETENNREKCSNCCHKKNYRNRGIVNPVGVHKDIVILKKRDYDSLCDVVEKIRKFISEMC